MPLLSSFLPEPSDQQSQFTIEDLYRSDLVMYDMDLSEGAILEKGHVYLVPLMERLKLPKDIRGRTNPKSSTGRLDIFTRVVTDLHVGFDEVRSGSIARAVRIELDPALSRTFTWGLMKFVRAIRASCFWKLSPGHLPFESKRDWH